MTTASPPPPPSASGQRSATIPWEDTSPGSGFDRFVATIRELATAPGQAFRSMPTAAGLGRPLLFAIVVGWISIFFASVWILLFGGLTVPFVDRSELGELGLAFGASTGILIVLMVLAPLFIIIGVFIQAAILHLMLLIVGGASHGFEATTRVCSYAYAAQLAQIIPFCGGLISAIWSLILLIVGFSEAHQIPRGKAAIAVILPVVLCCGFMVMLLFMGALAGVASSQ